MEKRTVLNIVFLAFFLILLTNFTSAWFPSWWIPNSTYIPSDVYDTGNSVKYNLGNVSVSVTSTQYPYVDLNSIDYFYVTLVDNNFNLSIDDSNVTIYLHEPSGINDTVNLPYNNATDKYSVGLLFNETGDYPFTINMSNGGFDYGTLSTGVLKVREPFYATIKLFNDKSLTNYKNNAGFITGEISNTATNPTAESFFHPLLLGVQQPILFHQNYVNGQAVLKLYENDTNYIFRFQDGISFNSTYQKPTIIKTFRNDMYLGKQYLNGTNMTYQFILSDKEKYPYKWLVNWFLVFAVIGISIISMCLFFVFPDKPQIALIFGILFIALLLISRIVLWFVSGW